MAVSRLNHAVLRVRDLERSLAFYGEVLGLQTVARVRNVMAFMRAPGSENHHDLGLARVASNAAPPNERGVGLYHLAWEVNEIEELRDVRAVLERLGAISGESDHGATKSIYAYDPDKNEFEVMWMVPREHRENSSAPPQRAGWISKPKSRAGAKRRIDAPRRRRGVQRAPAPITVGMRSMSARTRQSGTPRRTARRSRLKFVNAS